MMIRARSLGMSIAAVAMAIGAIGCGVPLESTAVQEQNACASQSDCAGAGVCSAVGSAQACVATSVDLQGLVLEVLPSPNPSIASGTSYLLDSENPGTDAAQQMMLNFVGRDPGGVVKAFNPTLPQPFSIAVGQIAINANDKGATCAGDDGASIAANVEFDRVTKLVGLPPASYTTTTTLVTPAGATALSYNAFSLSVPPDLYDVYVVPTAVPGCTKPALPPAFFPSDSAIGKQLSSSGGAPLNLQLPKLLTLSGDITVPNGVSIDGWIVELVEPSAGRLISTSSTLPTCNGLPPGNCSPLQFSRHFQTSYYWASYPALVPVIRLRPPDKVHGPTVHWDLATVDINGSGTVALSLSDVSAKPKLLEGSVVDENNQPVSANVSFESTDLGYTNASYQVAADTGADGQPLGGFSVQILPGAYRVLARPTVDPTKALAIQTDWQVKAEDLCCGRSILVHSKIALGGSAATADGRPMFDASIVASPSLPPPVSYFNGALSLTTILPREADTIPDTSGAFSLGVDSGQFDFSVRPRDGSLFPWLVRSKVTVASGETSGADLGALTVPFPAVLTGTIRDPSGVGVPDATVRAWLPVSNANVATGTVIQIGETKTDDLGNYVLPLLPSIAQ